MPAQPSENLSSSTAVLLCLGKFHQPAALEYWLAHHLAFDLAIFVSISKETKDAQTCQEILKILSNRFLIEILDAEIDAEKTEFSFYQKAKEKGFSFALRLALDEFFVPNFLDKKAEISDFQGRPALKIPYRHCGLSGHQPEKILKFGLNPRHYYTKMTDGTFAPDMAGRFLCALQEESQTFPSDFTQAVILHDAASSALSKPARNFFDQGTLKIPANASPFQTENLIAIMWQSLLSHTLITQKNLPLGLIFPPTPLSWHFLEMSPKNVLGIDHKTRELCAVPNLENDTYSRLILAKQASDPTETKGWLCLFDPAPFAFLPLKGLNSRTPALPVDIEIHPQTCQLKDSFTQQNILSGNQKSFTLLEQAKRDLPYPLAALDHLLAKGKATPVQKHLLDGFPAPPVTALWALMTRPEFFNANESFSLFSLLKALLSNNTSSSLPAK